MPTTAEMKDAQWKWIQKGLLQGYLIGPFEPSQVPIDNLILSPFGAVKQANKIRPIINMSSPKDQGSVNHSIKQSMKEVRYVSFREIVKLFFETGKDSFMWSVDAKDAYLVIPITKSDRRLMGFKFMNKIFIITTLMFGLSSACQIYTKFADSVEEIICNELGQLAELSLNHQTTLRLIRHYLDDFFGAHKNKLQATEQLTRVIEICKSLNLPLKLSKIQKPSQLLKLLGWLFDSKKQKVFIPKEKLDKIRSKLYSLIMNKYITILELKSIYGLLRWCFTAIYAGESLLLTLHQLIYRKKLHDWQQTRITQDVKQDSKLILSIIDSLANGIQYSWILNITKFEYTIWTDASEFGIGGYSTTGHWFHYSFPKNITKQIKQFNKPDMQWLELTALVIAIDLWKDWLKTKAVVLYTDNEPIEWNVRRWHIPIGRADKMILLRALSSILIINNIKFKVQGIRSIYNIGADALSRMKHDKDPAYWPIFIDHLTKQHIKPLPKQTPSKQKFHQYFTQFQNQKNLNNINKWLKQYQKDLKIINNNYK